MYNQKKKSRVALFICSIPFYDSRMQQKVQTRSSALQAARGSLLSFLQGRTQHVSPCRKEKEVFSSWLPVTDASFHGVFLAMCRDQQASCLIPEGSCHLLSLTVPGDYYRSCKVPTYWFDIILQRCKEVSSGHTQALCLLHIHFHFVAGLIKAIKDTEVQQYRTPPLINFHPQIQPRGQSASIRKMLFNKTFVGTQAGYHWSNHHLHRATSIRQPHKVINSCSTPLGAKPN